MPIEKIYNENKASGFVKDEKGEITHLVHSHENTTGTAYFSVVDQIKDRPIHRAQTNFAITNTIGCMGFFKEVAKDPNASSAEKALAQSAVDEDQARLDFLRKNRPSGCNIL
jgi:hypothetical protein